MKAILLAAGNSRRFGGNKLLEPFKGKLLYEYTLDLAKALILDEIILVTQYKEIMEREHGSGVTLVYNSKPEKGISESIKLGVRQAGQEADLIFFVCDQPYLEKETVIEMQREFYANPKGIVCARSKIRSGNPNIFAASFYDELLNLENDVGGKKVIKAHPEVVRYYEVNEKELRDMDYKEDFC